MKLIEKLEAIIAHPRKNGITSNRIVDSLKRLREQGKAYTGISERRRALTWTADVVKTLNTFGIPCEQGNDAPRGGKAGDFVKLTSPAMLKVINAEIAERKRIADLEEQERIERYNRMLSIAQNIKDGLYDDYLRANRDRILQPRENRATRKQFWNRICRNLGIINSADMRDIINIRVREID